MIQRKYTSAVCPCPIAVVLWRASGMFMIAGLEIPYGKNEYDAAGRVDRETGGSHSGPEDRIGRSGSTPRSPSSFIYPNDKIDERPVGPSGPAIYAGGLSRSRSSHRNDDVTVTSPILTGAIPASRRDERFLYRGSYRSGAVLNQLEAAGVPG